MTGLDLITDALSDLGVLAEGEVPTDTAATFGLRRLNALLGELRAESTAWSGLPDFDLSTDITADDGVESALVAMLAERLAPAYTKQVPPQVARVGRDGRQRVKRMADTSRDLTTTTPFDLGVTYDIVSGQ